MPAPQDFNWFLGYGREGRFWGWVRSPIELKDDLPRKLLQNLIFRLKAWQLGSPMHHAHPIFNEDYQSKIKNRKSKIALPTADGGNQYHFVAVLEDGVGGDEFQVEAETSTPAPLF